MINLTPQQLRKAADIQEKIQSLQNELNEILGGEVAGPVEATETPTKPKKRQMSAAGRAAIAAAAKARWAKIKGTAASAKPSKKSKRKMSAEGLANIRAGVAKRMAAQGKASATKPASRRKMSAAGLANIRAAQKARWAKAKLAG
jgi:hypothetical protein